MDFFSNPANVTSVLSVVLLLYLIVMKIMKQVKTSTCCGSSCTTRDVPVADNSVEDLASLSTAAASLVTKK